VVKEYKVKNTKSAVMLHLQHCSSLRRVTNDSLAPCQSYAVNIAIGDIVKLDKLMLGSSLQDGQCFINPSVGGVTH